METKVFVTGGAGLIGSAIVRELTEQGIESVLLDAHVRYFSYFDTEADLYQLYLQKRYKALKDNPKVKMVRGDTRNKDHLRRMIFEHKPTHIIHLAALPIETMSNQFSEEAIDSTLGGTVNLLEIIRDTDFVQRFVYTSSSMIYGDFKYTPCDEEHPKKPKGVYGGSKMCGEIMTQVYAERFNIEYAIVRPSAVYGPTDVNRRVSQIFVENALRGKPLIMKGGDTALDFTYISDIAHGFVLAALHPDGKNEAFNITRGEGRTLREMADIVSELIPNVEIIEEASDASTAKRGSLGIDKARQVLGYEPQYSLEQGLVEYVNFVRNCMAEIGNGHSN